MPLSITKEQFEQVPEAIRSQFKPDGDSYIFHPADFIPKSTYEDVVKKAERARNDLKTYEGIDPEKAREADRKLRELEEKLEAGGDDERITKLMEKRMAREREEHAAALAAAEKKRTDVEAKHTTAESRLRELLIDNALMSAAANLGVHKSAIEDVRLRGHAIFALEDGSPVPREMGNGKREERAILRDGDGKPMTPEKWLEAQKSVAPHWWPADVGGTGDLDASASNGKGAKNMKRADFDKLPPAEQFKRVKDGLQITD